MHHYLSIVRKQDFIDLFRYGRLKIFSVQAHHFSGVLDKHVEDKALFERLTYGLNYMQYSFEYLLLHFTQDSYRGGCLELSISDMLGVYALDEDGKRELCMSLDAHLEIQISPWATWFENWMQEQILKQAFAGVDSLWTIFNLSSKDKRFCKKILPPKEVLRIYQGLWANEQPTRGNSFWEHLLRYERHGLYPKELKGFYYDLIYIILNFDPSIERDNGRSY